MSAFRALRREASQMHTSSRSPHFSHASKTTIVETATRPLRVLIWFQRFHGASNAASTQGTIAALVCSETAPACKNSTEHFSNGLLARARAIPIMVFGRILRRFDHRRVSWAGAFSFVVLSNVFEADLTGRYLTRRQWTHSYDCVVAILMRPES